MAAEEIRVGDVGTVFRTTVRDTDAAGVVVPVDISAANPRQLKFKKPDGTLLTKTAVLTGSGTDGQMQYSTVAGDLDVEGIWQVQGYIKIGNNEWHTDIHLFKVHPNL